VFREWARSWAQRTMIQNAVRMFGPRANRSAATTVAGGPINCRFGQTQEADAAIASILGLEDFERFVSVMSVLEKYSDQDCSVLPGCSRQEVRETRMRALEHVAESVSHVDTVSNTWTGSDKVIIAPPPARSEILATPP
jgi:hypothetical protein